MHKKKIKIPGYEPFARNRAFKSAGGVGTLVDKEQLCFTAKVKEGDFNDEFVITKHSQFKTPINVINWYGEIESRTSNADIYDRWLRLQSEISKIEMKSENLIFVGDMNKHVGGIIKDNHSDVSYGGKLIREFLDSGKYVLVNALNVTEGGPFTRYDPSKPCDDAYKSCLDLIIVSKDLVAHIDQVTIDSDLTFTPGRATRNGLCYTDHYSILFSLQNLPLANAKRSKKRSIQMWNLNKEGGWAKYTSLTENNEKLAKTTVKNSDVTKVMKSIDNELTKVKFQSFGKVSFQQNVKCNKKVKSLIDKKSSLVKKHEACETKHEAIAEINRQISDEILIEKGRTLEKEIGNLRIVKEKKGP